jgi:simple sugar transport system permease protein
MTNVATLSGPRTTEWSARLNQLALLPVIVLSLVVGSVLHPAFMSETNLMNILQQSSELSVLVLAETLILIAGKFDLSLESIVGLAPMVAAWSVCPVTMGGSGWGLNGWLALLLLFAVGALVGSINAGLIVGLQLNAFIATLAMLILLRGVTVGLSGGNTLYDLPTQLTWLGSTEILGVAASIWVAALLFLVVGMWLRFHRIGRAIYAVGGNRMSARAAGILDRRVLFGVFVAGGILAAVAGLLLTGRLASVGAAQGQNLIFTAFAAAVIGRISLNGGRGTVTGALSGVVLLGIISNILTLSNVPTFWISAAFGGIILLALVIARLTTGESDDDF